jgi:superfamily II RNA helicase
LQQAQARLQELEAIAGRRSSSANQGLGTSNLIEQQRAKIDELTAAMQRYSQASVDEQQRQQSFAQAAAVRNQLPEIDQLQALRNEQEKLVKTMVDVQTTGGPASEMLKRMGLSYEELAKALSIANSNMTQFKSGFQSSFDQAKIAGDALTAFSPGARGDIARRQSMESTLGSKMTDGERLTLAQQAYSNAVKSVTVSLSEQA